MWNIWKMYFNFIVLDFFANKLWINILWINKLVLLLRNKILIITIYYEYILLIIKLII